jgi:hypothetical protein
MVSAPHPLAVALIERLHSRPGSRILDFAAGSGRNGEALRRAGFTVLSLDDAAAAAEDPLRHFTEPFAAVISTHGLLHGDAEAIEARVRSIARSLETDGLLFATFGSSRDARFGEGERLGDATVAPLEGDERGVPHTYFDRAGLTALLAPLFEIESLDEHGVDDVAGRWAHSHQPLRGAAHWFAVGTKS